MKRLKKSFFLCGFVSFDIHISQDSKGKGRPIFNFYLSFLLDHISWVNMAMSSSKHIASEQNGTGLFDFLSQVADCNQKLLNIFHLLTLRSFTLPHTLAIIVNHKNWKGSFPAPTLEYLAWELCLKYYTTVSNYFTMSFFKFMKVI